MQSLKLFCHCEEPCTQGDEAISSKLLRTGDCFAPLSRSQ